MIRDHSPPIGAHFFITTRVKNPSPSFSEGHMLIFAHHPHWIIHLTPWLLPLFFLARITLLYHTLVHMYPTSRRQLAPPFFLRFPRLRRPTFFAHACKAWPPAMQPLPMPPHNALPNTRPRRAQKHWDGVYRRASLNRIHIITTTPTTTKKVTFAAFWPAIAFSFFSTLSPRCTVLYARLKKPECPLRRTVAVFFSPVPVAVLRRNAPQPFTCQKF